MPTVALLPGHAFAGGFMTAMMHDYRLMNPHRGFLCLNELDFGSPLKPPMASIFRQKVPSPNTYRTMILESKRYGALEGLKEGLLDGLGGMDEVLIFVKEMGLVDRGKTGVYGRLKQEMWREIIRTLNSNQQIQLLHISPLYTIFTKHIKPQPPPDLAERLGFESPEIIALKENPQMRDTRNSSEIFKPLLITDDIEVKKK